MLEGSLFKAQRAMPQMMLHELPRDALEPYGQRWLLGRFEHMYSIARRCDSYTRSFACSRGGVLVIRLLRFANP